MDTFGNRLWDTWSRQIGTSSDKQNDDSRGQGDLSRLRIQKGKSKSSESESDLLGTFITKSIEMKNSISEGGYLGNNTNNTNNDNNDNKEGETNSSPTTNTYVDKFMEKIISMAIPTTTTSSKKELNRVLERIEIQKNRPSLSMQIMSRNSILLLQRLTIPFETIDMITNIINWESPLITITVLLFITITILKPINLITIPLFYTCFEIIIPAYMIQNPNIDESVKSWENELPKPVNEFSREFLLNVTDLQNRMMLYINSWDFINAWCWKLFYFRDELLTWSIFVGLLFTGLIIELFGSNVIFFMLPYLKLLMVILVWVLVISLHPKNREKFLKRFYSEEVRLKTVTLLNRCESKLLKDLDLKNDEMEIRQIEIFELQYFNEDTKSWQFACFSKDMYPLNSHIRLNNLPITGTLILDGVQAPEGWKFVNKDLRVNSQGIAVPNSSGSHDDSTKKHENNNNDHHHQYNSSNNTKRLIFDHEKNKLNKQKRKYEKMIKKKEKKAAAMNESYKDTSKNSSIQRRRESNDFNNILLDPITINEGILEKLETGINHEGWYLDMCPTDWVNNNYLYDVFDIDEESKWVYDLIVMGNGAEAYSAGLGASNKLKKSRGDVRRRRWVRYAVREIISDKADEINEINAGNVGVESDYSLESEETEESESDSSNLNALDEEDTTEDDESVVIDDDDDYNDNDESDEEEGDTTIRNESFVDTMHVQL